MLTKQNLSLRLPAELQTSSLALCEVLVTLLSMQEKLVSNVSVCPERYVSDRPIVDADCCWRHPVPVSVLLKWRHPLHPYKQLGGAVGEGLCWLKCVGMTWIFFAVTLLFVSNCSRPSSRPPPHISTLTRTCTTLPLRRQQSRNWLVAWLKNRRLVVIATPTMSCCLV